MKKMKKNILIIITIIVLIIIMVLIKKEAPVNNENQMPTAEEAIVMENELDTIDIDAGIDADMQLIDSELENL